MHSKDKEENLLDSLFSLYMWNQVNYILRVNLSPKKSDEIIAMKIIFFNSANQSLKFSKK